MKIYIKNCLICISYYFLDFHFENLSAVNRTLLEILRALSYIARKRNFPATLLDRIILVIMLFNNNAVEHLMYYFWSF